MKTLRLDLLNETDKQFFLLFVFTEIFGFISNWVRTSPNISDDWKNYFQVFAVGFNLLWIAFIMVKAVKSIYVGEDVGFSLRGWRTGVLIAVSFAVVVYSAFTLGKNETAFSSLALWVVYGQVIEECIYRPLLINFFSKVFSGARNAALLAILMSAFLWALVHIPSKPFAQVIGIFFGGLMFGALFYWSKSNIAAFVLHTLANGGVFAGIITFGLYFVLAPLFRRDRTAVRKIGSGGTA